MIKPELYQKTVDVLVQAYFNDTLISWNCSACAVGNLVAAGMGYKSCETRRNYYINNKGKSVYAAWASVHSMDFFGGHVLQDVHREKYTGDAKTQIDSTGYSFTQTARIEKAFEAGYRISDPDYELSEDEKMFNGLCAVIDALDKIHKNTDPEITVKSKSMFIK